MKQYEDIKKAVREQCRNREAINPFTEQPMTVKEWEEMNKRARKELKVMGVKCRTAFYNPNDNKVYIKQSFRNVRINGLVQWTCSMEDFTAATGEEPKGYYHDDPYFAAPCSRNIDFLF